mgnify:CR=1 FL=1
MSEHEPEFAAGFCSQGCGRHATTKTVRIEHGVEVHSPYCQPCQDLEIQIEQGLQEPTA